MTKKKKGKSVSLAKWESLAWADLEQWAGSRSVTRGRAYQRQDRVENLGVTSDGKILATVEGSTEYYVQIHCTKVEKKASLDSTCSCPVGTNCKHAVAATLELLDMLAENTDIPAISDDDPRLEEFNSPDGIWDDDDKVYLASGNTADKSMVEKIRKHIFSKDREELAELVLSFTQEYPEIYNKFHEKICLETKDFSQLLKDTEDIISTVTSEPVWTERWGEPVELPDYTGLQKRLESLLQAGLFDDLATLGMELLTDGVEQIEQSHDEGELSMALCECMEIIFQAVAKSSMTNSEKILYLIEAYLEEDYGILDDAETTIFELDHSAEDWLQVAEALSVKLKKMPAKKTDDFGSNKYQYQKINKWRIRALENSGRTSDLRQIYEQEAQKTGDYNRLLRYLIDEKLYDEAIELIEQQITEVPKKYPGITSQYINFLSEIALKQKQWKVIAAYDAWRFFNSPSLGSFNSLLKAAGKAKCKTQIQKFARKFLETGNPPVKYAKGKKIKSQADWPLPTPHPLVPLMKEIATKSPLRNFEVLLDIALEAKNNEAILHWYDAQKKGETNNSSRYGYHPSFRAQSVAHAVTSSHPLRALEIYHDIIKSLLPDANQNNYSEIGSYLKTIKPIYKKLKQEQKWYDLLNELRTEYKRRPRFVEILDTLDCQTILQSQKQKKRCATQ